MYKISILSGILIRFIPFGAPPGFRLQNIYCHGNNVENLPIKMLRICLLLIKDTFTITLQDTNYCLKIIFLLFLNTNLANVNINSGILISNILNVAPPQHLVFAPGAPISINTVCSRNTATYNFQPVTLDDSSS